MLERLNQVRKMLLVRTIVFIFGFFVFWSWFANYVQKNKAVMAGNIVFVLDLSNSMNVRDVFYNAHQVSRLKLAKKIIENNVKNVDNKFWLIIFADKFNYFIPPTYDKYNFLNFLKSVNTNYLNWWQTNVVALFSGLNNYLWKLDQVVILSDFDFWDLKSFKRYEKYKLNNYTYFIWIGTNAWWIVKNAEWKTLFENWNPLTSSLNEKILKKLAFKNWQYQIVTSYEQWQVLSFLKRLKNKNTLQQNHKINWRFIIWIALILISL